MVANQNSVIHERREEKYLVVVDMREPFVVAELLASVQEQTYGPIRVTLIQLLICINI